jgi:tellurite resistance protein TehA-like permease
MLKNAVRSFSPGYFALVMATGILSIASHLLHHQRVADFLFMLNIAQYLLLVLCLTLRLIFFFPECVDELGRHDSGASFLSFIAASAVVGTGYVQLKQSFTPARILLATGITGWLLMFYGFIGMVILKKKKPSLEKGMNGSWLLIVVATQSLVILGTSLAEQLPATPQTVLFMVSCGWLFGLLMYIVFLTIILYRLAFYPVTAEEMSPSYWIDAGAGAITTLAGLTVLQAITGKEQFQDYAGLIKTGSLLTWASASWWLPLLAIMETWRHIKAGFKYSAAYWSLVFPLGMYSVASYKLAMATQTTLLVQVSGLFYYLAAATWMIVFAGMLYSLARPKAKSF